MLKIKASKHAEKHVLLSLALLWCLSCTGITSCVSSVFPHPCGSGISPVSPAEHLSLQVFTALFNVHVFAEVLCAPLVLFWCTTGPFCPLLRWLEAAVTSTVWSMATLHTRHHCSTLAAQPCCLQNHWILCWIQVSALRTIWFVFFGGESERQGF